VAYRKKGTIGRRLMMTMPDDELIRSDHIDPDDRDLETPAADAVEQATPANPIEASAPEHREWDAGGADEYDAWEQSVVVDLDEDYR
jgi:hypothetical protein